MTRMHYAYEPSDAFTRSKRYDIGEYSEKMNSQREKA
jgi:hypothetical protein